MRYDADRGYRYNRTQRTRRRKPLKLFAIFLVFIVGTVVLNRIFFSNEPDTVEEQVQVRLEFSEGVSEPEKAKVEQAFVDQSIALTASVETQVNTAQTATNTNRIVEAYVPVTHRYAVRQSITSDQLTTSNMYVLAGTDQNIIDAIAAQLGRQPDSIMQLNDIATLSREDIAFIPASEVSTDVKVLGLDNAYYFDAFTSGAIFREVSFTGDGVTDTTNLSLGALTEDTVFKTNVTGVTALTREMMNKLAEVGDPLFFSQKIGNFLADADLTHVSNEVSFKENCDYSRTLFCSPPEFIETLKASGVDLVELTGNHNNDLGAQLNTSTITQYRELGWGTVGGGLNTEDAAKPFTTTQDGSTVTFLAYNFPDSPNGGAIAGSDKAGANSFEFARIESDIAAAKTTSDFVIVNIQYWECYAYPDGYIEYPTCDVPIGEQEANFKRVVDLGADMVVGTSAHQPQTWEFYEDKPIYYGLGNMYFEQTQWPGTERGIVLSNYFVDGVLVQTKLTPTVYGDNFQPRVMTESETEFLLTRLDDAR